MKRSSGDEAGDKFYMKRFALYGILALRQLASSPDEFQKIKF